MVPRNKRANLKIQSIKWLIFKEFSYHQLSGNYFNGDYNATFRLKLNIIIEMDNRRI